MFPHPRSLALLLSAGIFSGCAVGPDYRPPLAELTSTFLGQKDVEQRQAQGKADLQRWWAAFDDAMLAHLVALRDDAGLRRRMGAAARATVEARFGSDFVTGVRRAYLGG